jgi:hypothetical protein
MKSSLEIIWKTIPDFNFYYEASNTGLIRSKQRTIDAYSYKAQRNIKLNRKSHLLSQNIRGKGYKYVCICVDGFMKKEQVHKLVLMAFKGHRPDGMVACHNDGNPSNNNLLNLRWDTPKENYLDMERHGTRPKGEKIGTSKFVSEQINLLKKCATYKDAQLICEISRTHFYRIKRGESWSHL